MVRAGRLVILVSFFVATAFLYRLVSALYDPVVGLLAAGFFATSPMIVQVSRAVMSEMTTMALVLAGAYYLYQPERASVDVSAVSKARLSWRRLPEVYRDGPAPASP